MKPVVAIYSTFLQRAYDQVVHDLCLQEADVALAIDRAGIVGGDGATHQGVFDVAYLRHLPGTVLLAASDAAEMEKMLEFAVRTHGVVALRYPRASCPEHAADACAAPVLMGKALLLRDGADGAIVAYGAMVYPALEAAQMLAADGINAAVVNARFAKPLDEELLAALTARQPFILTVEDHVVTGGFGSAVLEFVEEKCAPHPPVVRMGVPEGFVEHGGRNELLEHFGLDARGICEKFKKTASLVQGRAGKMPFETKEKQ
jgi:1-deoxy-D-xylulose-5-phosphate synthase